MTESENIHPAYALKPKTRIKLADQELTLRDVQQYDDWVELYFTEPMWDAHTEEWKSKFGCHRGFCIEVIAK